MKNNFCSIGISHWNCPIEIREKFSVSRKQSKIFIEDCISQGIKSVFTISTCNRTQVFSYNTNIHQLKKIFLKHTGNHEAEFDKYGFIMEGENAITQLFEVSTGIDSQILGDLQIFY